MVEKEMLCPFCGAYGPRQCELIDDAGCCPWEEAEEEGLALSDALSAAGGE